VFYQNDSYGMAGLTGVTRALTRRNLKPAATATAERNSVNVTAALQTLLKASPEATRLPSSKLRGINRVSSTAR
jgi:branched-chain amino acid transport system substrate-binding protein